jgi:hypothetical protein
MNTPIHHGSFSITRQRGAPCVTGRAHGTGDMLRRLDEFTKAQVSLA